jgi:hypothetical protein
MQIITQLDDDAANKLTYIQQQTGQDTEAVLKAAINQYYQQLQPPQTPLEALTQSGFIGCGSAEPDLSANYKTVLQEELQKKYDHR